MQGGPDLAEQPIQDVTQYTEKLDVVKHPAVKFNFILVFISTKNLVVKRPYLICGTIIIRRGLFFIFYSTLLVDYKEG